jgi:hypothetical protein
MIGTKIVLAVFEKNMKIKDDRKAVKTNYLEQ